MAREIKFRAWDDGEKEWLLGYNYGSLGGFSLYGECMLLGEWSDVLNAFLLSPETRRPDDLKVMQFTGLKDKNGKEIFEGDIVSQSDGYIQQEVLWGKQGWEPACLDECEVIGNIYENPELLK